MGSQESDRQKEIYDYYAKRATTAKYATSPDMNLREVEIEYLCRELRDGEKVLDVGCGNGYLTWHAGAEQVAFSGGGLAKRR